MKIYDSANPIEKIKEKHVFRNTYRYVSISVQRFHFLNRYILSKLCYVVDDNCDGLFASFILLEHS